jgi:hypothetical protein
MADEYLTAISTIRLCSYITSGAPSIATLCPSQCQFPIATHFRSHSSHKSDKPLSTIQRRLHIADIARAFSWLKISSRKIPVSHRVIEHRTTPSNRNHEEHHHLPPRGHLRCLRLRQRRRINIPNLLHLARQTQLTMPSHSGERQAAANAPPTSRKPLSATAGLVATLGAS